MKVTLELVKEGGKCPLLIECLFEFLMALLQLRSHSSAESGAIAFWWYNCLEKTHVESCHGQAEETQL